MTHHPTWRYLEVHGINDDGTCTCGRPGCVPIGKHPTQPGWTASACPNPEIRPGYNIGLATGQGIVVLDFDGSEGLATLETLSKLADLSGAWTQNTGSGGTHLLFTTTEHIKNAVRILPGMDVRGEGGMIVVAPSKHKSGKAYTIVHDPEDPAPLPQEIEDIILRGKQPSVFQRAQAIEAVKDWAKRQKFNRAAWRLALSGQPWAEEGERETTLFAMCQALARAFPAATPESLASIFALPDGRPIISEAGLDLAAAADKIHRCQELHRSENLDKPAITLGTDDSLIIREATVTLATRALELGIYSRSERLCYVSPPEPKLDLTIRGQAPQEIKPIPQSALGTHLSSAARWISGAGPEAKPTLPPPRIVRAFAEHGVWPEIPYIEGIVYGPTLRSDGSLWAGIGYDARTGLYGVEGWEPALTDRETAWKLIWDLVEEFPWDGPASFSSWLALILSSIARYAYTGPSPLFLLDANTPGCGKTLLAVMASYIATGRGPSRGSGMGVDQEEDRKKITTLARGGARVILIDNIKGNWGTAILEEALTIPDGIWQDRLLGGNESYIGPLQAVWCATSNNVRLKGDLHRRVCYCRLEGPEDPSSRTFRIASIDEETRTRRRELYDACLSILVEWARTGRQHQLPPWGSYESWSSWVRGAIVHAGLADPAESRGQAASDNDVVRDLVLGLAEVIQDLGGSATPGQISDAVFSAGAIISGQYEIARNALVEAHPRNRDPQTGADVGRVLATYRGRVAGGLSLHPRTRVARDWVVR